MLKNLVVVSAILTSVGAHAQNFAPHMPLQKDLFAEFDFHGSAGTYVSSLSKLEIEEIIEASRGSKDSFQAVLDSFGPDPEALLSAVIDTRWDISGERSLQLMKSFIDTANTVSFERDITRYQLYLELSEKTGFQWPWSKTKPNTKPE